MKIKFKIKKNRMNQKKQNQYLIKIIRLIKKTKSENLIPIQIRKKTRIKRKNFNRINNSSSKNKSNAYNNNNNNNNNSKSNNNKYKIIIIIYYK